jgi:hypothetical protein
MPEGSSGSIDAVVAFGKLLADTELREKFASGAHDEALRQHGVEPSSFPTNVLEIFRGMSAEELRFIAETCDKLVAADLYIKLPGGGVLCYL